LGFLVGFLLPTLHIKAAGGLPVAALPEEDETARQRGVLSDRFTKESVVLTAPAKPKAGGGELQLSSMSALTNKTSSQSFFLRVLKAKKIIVEFFPQNSLFQCLGSGFIGSGSESIGCPDPDPLVPVPDPDPVF
jgi:hypothetical protein